MESEPKPKSLAVILEELWPELLKAADDQSLEKDPWIIKTDKNKKKIRNNKPKPAENLKKIN